MEGGTSWEEEGNPGKEEEESFLPGYMKGVEVTTGLEGIANDVAAWG